MKYTRLFEPGKIGKLEIKNRVVVTPVGLPYAESNGEVSSRLTEYLRARAKGGAGIIMSGIVLIDSNSGKNNPNELVLENQAQAASFARLARTIHDYDAKLFLQLYHPGRSTNSTKLSGRQAWSASPVKTTNGELAKEMTIEDIRHITQCYARAAAMAKSMGVDGVEIHAAHGYLLGQFLTPLFNHRTDEYGGSFENRMRFVVEIYEAMRTAVGTDFPIGIRISANEFIEGGNTLEDGVKMAKVYDDLGMDFIDVSCGLQESSQFNREPPSFQQGWKKNLAKSVKAAVACPVIAVNTVKRPDFAETLLQEEVCDFVGLSRGHLAEPEWTNKARDGKEDEIRICISCLHCMDTFLQGLPPTCTSNPMLGRESEFGQIIKNGNGRAVVVIGGGPAGLEAAFVLAKRGFAVTLFEKDEKLGGQMNLAEKAPGKSTMTWMKEGMETRARKAGVRIKVNTEPTIDEIKALDPIGIFCSVGSVPIRPEGIPGIYGENVTTVQEVMQGGIRLDNKKIVIVGSGLTGLECGLYLKKQNCNIEYVEMNSKIGMGIFSQVLTDILDEFGEGKPQMHTCMKVTEIQKDGVACVDQDGNRTEIKAEQIILAMGVTPQLDYVRNIKSQLDNVIVIGDAGKTGRLIDAVTDGYIKATLFEA